MSRERNLLWALQKQEEEEIEGLTTGLIRFSRKGKREREKNFCVSKSEDRVRREETNYLARADGRADDRPLLPGNEIKRNKPDLPPPPPPRPQFNDLSCVPVTRSRTMMSLSHHCPGPEQPPFWAAQA